MRAIFADTNYWVAVLAPADQWHQTAMNVSQHLPADTQLVTTAEVVAEVLNLVSSRFPRLRGAVGDWAAALSRTLTYSPALTGTVLLLPSPDAFDGLAL